MCIRDSGHPHPTGQAEYRRAVASLHGRADAAGAAIGPRGHPRPVVDGSRVERPALGQLGSTAGAGRQHLGQPVGPAAQGLAPAPEQHGPGHQQDVDEEERRHHPVADLVMSLVTLVFAIVFLTGYLLLIQAVFRAGQPGDGVMATFFFVDILLVAGTVLFWRGRKSLRRGADRLAQVLATRPGGGAQLPQRRLFDPAAVYYRTRMAAGAYRGARG